MTGRDPGAVRWPGVWGVAAVLAAAVVAVAAGPARAGDAGTGSSLGAAVGRVAAERQVAVRVLAVGCQGYAVGSGALVGDGRVVTNRHVVAGGDYVEVQVADGPRIGARVERVGGDVDLAVLWVGGTRPAAAPGGRLQPGTRTHVLSHPGGGPLVEADATVTARAVYDQPGMRSEVAFLDAGLDGDLGPGSSGGPVFDGGGRFVGVVFGIEDHTGLVATVDGDTVAAFLAGAGRSGDPAACEPER